MKVKVSIGIYDTNQRVQAMFMTRLQYIPDSQGYFGGGASLT